jgi:hypothetical protein
VSKLLRKENVFASNTELGDIKAAKKLSQG